MRPTIQGLHHDHIDGSAALVNVIHDLYRLAGKEFPFPGIYAWRDFFKNPHEDIIKRFGTVTSVMQTEESLRLVGYEYGKHRAKEGYAYVEAKFAPQYHTAGGLTLRQAGAAMFAGLKRAETECAIRIHPQFCIGREADPDAGIEIARVVLEYDGEVSLDLACSEPGNPPEKHLPAYRLTFGTNVRRDCHAGEWVEREPHITYRARLLRNVRAAVNDLRCDGLGHAIPLIHDAELVAKVAGQGIRVAGCPAAYVKAGLIKDVRHLGIDRLLDAGVLYTVNADDDLFLPTMAEAVDLCEEAYRFTPAQATRLEMNVFTAAFGF